MTEAQQSVNEAAEAIRKALLALHKVCKQKCPGWHEFDRSDLPAIYFGLVSMDRRMADCVTDEDG